jgi:hypothetical protein
MPCFVVKILREKAMGQMAGASGVSFIQFTLLEYLMIDQYILGED